jgi:hypothetical protein
MTTLREALRLLLVAIGVVCCVVAGVVAVCLACSRSLPGVVETGSKLYRGEATNYAYVRWGYDRSGGIILHPEAGDWPSTPKAGDSVRVPDVPLIGPKGGILRSTGALWRVFGWAVVAGASGTVLVVTGLFVVRDRSSRHEPQLV